MNAVVPILILAAVILVLLFIVFVSTWKVAEPNQALIISGINSKAGGVDGKGFRIVTGKGTLVIPGIQKVRRLLLNIHRVGIDEPCVTSQGIDVGISAVVIFKIGDDQASISNAARRFLEQEDQMDSQVHDVFAGHLRSIVGSLRMEDLLMNRQALADGVRDASSSELQKLGLIVDSLQIDHIEDPSGYITNLGKPHVARVQSEARIAQAEANQLAIKREQETAALNAEAERDSRVKQAAAQADIEQAQARAAQSGPLAEAEAQQQVVQKQTELAELAAARKEKELESQVRKPADAEAYRNVTLAEAGKRAQILSAEADAERTRLNGTAEADATKAVGEAEGIVLSARRDALAHGGDAVIAQLLAEKYPEIVREAAAAFGHVGNMTVLNGAEGMTSMLNSVLSQGAALYGPLRKMAADSSRSSGFSGGSATTTESRPDDISVESEPADGETPAAHIRPPKTPPASGSDS